MENLLEWTIQYVKNKDLTFRKLVKYTENKDKIDFEFKDKKVTYFITNGLNDKSFDLIKNHEHKVLVCSNILENFNFLIKHWKKFSEHRNLSILFINLKLNEKWIINPHTHNMIADPETIEPGLRTMFETANGKTLEIKAGKKKASMFEESSSNEDEEEN